MVYGDVVDVKRDRRGVLLTGVFRGLPLLGSIEFTVAIPNQILKVLIAEGDKP